MAEFLVIYTPCRPSLANDADERERAIVGEHFAYLSRAHEVGRLVLAGRTQDEPPMGLGVFEAPDDDDARRFVSADPAVAAGVFSAQVRPYRVALLAGRPAD